MATPIVSTTPDASTLPDSRAISPRAAPTFDQMTNAAKSMDAIAQSGFDQVEALAHMTLLAMQSPSFYRQPEKVAHVLQVIRDLALMQMDGINCEAEDVGVAYRDEGQRLRMDAHQQAREAIAADMKASPATASR